MGFDIKRFAGEVNHRLICTICSDVFEDPVQTPTCEHVFCRECITRWLEQSPSCPNDRQRLEMSDLKEASRLLKDLLADLSISCDFTTNGCEKYIKLDQLSHHVKDCEFSPEALVICSKGCGAELTRSAANSHLIAHLQDEVTNREETIKRLAEESNRRQVLMNMMRANMQKQDKDLTELRSEIEKERKLVLLIRVEKEELAKKGSEREAKLKQLQDKHEILLRGGNELRIKNQEIVDQKEEMIKRLTREIKGKQNTINQMRANKQKLGEALDELRMEMENATQNLQESVNEREEKLNQLQNENDCLSREINERKSENNRLVNRNSELRTSYIEENRLHWNLGREKKEVEETLGAKIKQLKALNDTISQENNELLIRNKGFIERSSKMASSHRLKVWVLNSDVDKAVKLRNNMEAKMWREKEEAEDIIKYLSIAFLCSLVVILLLIIWIIFQVNVVELWATFGRFK